MKRHASCRRFASNRHEQTVQNRQRRRRISRHFHVHRQNVRHAFGANKAFGKHPAGQRARADGNDSFGRRHGIVNLFQCDAHVIRHRADDQQHVGVARRRRDEKSQPVHVVIGIIELLDFVEARAAIASVHDKDVNGAVEWLAKFVLDRHGPFPTRRIAANQPDAPCRERSDSNECSGDHPPTIRAVALAEYPRRTALHQRGDLACGNIAAHWQSRRYTGRRFRVAPDTRWF